MEISVKYLQKNPFYHFSVDDVFDSLIEITDKKMNVFRHPFFSFLKGLHDEFGTNVDLYLFFQKIIDGKLRTLKDVSSSLKSTFEANPWIRFGPHALDYETPPYTQTPDEQIEVFNKTYNEIYRFSGEKNLSKWVRLHYFSESYELADYFHFKGIESLFTTDKDRITTRMPEINDILMSRGFTDYNGLRFIRSHVRAENLGNEDISTEELKKLIESYIEEHRFISFFTHEYEILREDVRSITKDAISHLHAMKIPSY
ncbi:hypothetical protein COU59_01865 [Candidatus Pacearchaeota archaeon CG10_big_fil_rev_8_21_14_0_10_34_12]|nr:MAG: hypothetical protein COU59_01865 [Candidatus Pacearchaeota archaeon CG10_big_fil_rev_8_21_14_0_10_34_12]